MVDVLTSHTFQVEDQTTHYLSGGPPDGPLLIFLHGWPDVALTWKLQLQAFVGLGFRVIAPDMRGFGQSSAPKDRLAYRLEQLLKEQLALLAQIKRDKAVWIGHDWGAVVVSALAAHHSEVVNGAVWLSVPYGVHEKGMDALVATVNRDRYPEDEYAYGQWSYMKYYEQNTDKAIEELSQVSDRFLKSLYLKSKPENWGKRAPTSHVFEDDSWFSRWGGSPDGLTDFPLEATSLDEELYTVLREDKRKNGWFPGTAYYLNNDANAEYHKSSKNDGVLDMPCLFIDTKYDPICSSTTSPKFYIPMTKACRNLTEVSIEAAHWAHREKPMEVNAALAKWLADQLPQLWPIDQTVL